MAYTNLIISEYIEGSSFNKAIEIFNGTGSAIDLGAGGYTLTMYFNGSAAAGLTINLTGTVAAGDVFVVAPTNATNATVLAQADQRFGTAWFNGDDAVVLSQGNTVLDVVGQIGFDPGSEWGIGLTSTQDNTLRRKTSVEAGDSVGNDAFDPAVQWDGFAIDSYDDLGLYGGGGGGGGGGGTPAFIHAVQGSGSTSPLAGQTVIIEAIVVGDFQGAAGLGGFFVQEEDNEADADPNTSEGLFVFQGATGVEVAVGDKVRITGVVTEFNSGTGSLTELGNLSGVTVLASGQPLPAATTLSFPVATTGLLESLEGMRITVNTPMTVTDNFTLGRFGEVLLSTDGPGNQPGTDARLDQFTQFNDPDATGNANYLATIATRRLVLDDGSDDQNPATVWGRDGQPLSATNTLRGGDTVASFSGVLDERFGDASIGNYRLQPTAPVDFDATNPRSADPGVDGRIKVASFNVLNYFNGTPENPLDDGFPTSRGAETPAELQRQQDKLVAALVGIDADVVGLLELENDGYGPSSAIATLVAALNADGGAGTYAYIDPGRPRLGTDEIAVGFIYRTTSVQPVGAAAVLDKTVDPRFDSDNQRPSLAQSFQDLETGALFTPVINHLKSKGSAAGLPGDTDQGDGQGLSNATRTQAALALADWIATDPTHQGDGDYIVMGDLNAYAMEDPLQALRDGSDGVRGTSDDLVDAVDASSYSFSFDGQWGSLDHALVSGSLLDQLVDAGKWHINSDEPTALDYNVNFKSPAQQASYYAPDAYRSTDHDPVVLGLDPGLLITGDARSQALEGTVGNDTLRAGGGRDAVKGGAGDDTFVFASLLDAYDTILDFEPQHDKLSIAPLMASVNAAAAKPVEDGYLRVIALPLVPLGALGAAVPAYTLVLFDPDGFDGTAAARPLAELIGVSVLDAADLLG